MRLRGPGVVRCSSRSAICGSERHQPNRQRSPNATRMIARCKRPSRASDATGRRRDALSSAATTAPDSDAFRGAQNDQPVPDANEEPFDGRRLRPRVHAEPRSRGDTRRGARRRSATSSNRSMRSPRPRATGRPATCPRRRRWRLFDRGTFPALEQLVRHERGFHSCIEREPARSPTRRLQAAPCPGPPRRPRTRTPAHRFPSRMLHQQRSRSPRPNVRARLRPSGFARRYYARAFAGRREQRITPQGQHEVALPRAVHRRGLPDH